MFQQYSESSGFVALNGTFDRERYQLVSGVMRAVIASEYGYVPVDGENWIYELLSESGETISILEYYYSDGGLYATIDKANTYFLGYLGDPSQFWLIGSFYSRCLEEGLYTVKVSHSGATVPDTFFTPTAFKPGTPEFGDIAPIKPYLPTDQVASKFGGGEAEIATIAVTIHDSLGCGKPLKDITVTFSNTIVPESNGHKHFSSSSEIGTGKYLSGTPSDGVLIWDEKYAISITGKTGENGQFSAEYQAGIFGVNEKVKAIIEDPDDEFSTIEAETILAIRVPGLVPLDLSGDTYRVIGTFSSPCDLQHNDSHTARRSHYVRPYFRTTIQELNTRFHDDTGEHLCLNDASLQNGGFFDDGETTETRGGWCHRSHRAGIDIDVNRECTGINMNDTFSLVDEQGKQVKPIPKREYLDYLADKLHLFKAPEDPLHYRLVDEFELVAEN